MKPPRGRKPKKRERHDTPTPKQSLESREQSREQRAEQSRAEQSRAEQSREQSRAEPRADADLAQNDAIGDENGTRAEIGARQ